MRAALVAGVAGLVALALACGDRAPVPAGPQADLLGLLSHAKLMQCAALAPDSVTEMIGPDGGVISVGPHTLTIPAGALGDTVAITAVAPSDTVNAVHFEPHGLTFARPASLTMSYANCAGAGSMLAKQVAYTTDDLVIIDLLGGLDDLSASTLTTNIGHFSDYAIAW